MVGPWQSSRYLMAKNEHVVVRSSLYSALGIFFLELLVGMSAVTVNLLNPNLGSASHVLIWASMNVLPKGLGIVMLTGVLAAGISSATTFLSLIGSSVANDICKGKGNTIRIGRITMTVVSVLVLLLAIFNPPQIFWIMFFGGSIVASSWMPVAVASILSKRVTKTGAFCGMLAGFIACFSVKLYTSLTGAALPVFLDPTVVGIVVNIIALVTGSMMTSVTEEEKNARKQLFLIPEEEKDVIEVRKTRTYLKLTVLLGIVVAGVLLSVWACPVMMAKR